MTDAPPPPAAWLAVIYGHENRRMPLAMGQDQTQAFDEAMRKFAGTTTSMQSHYRERIRFVRLDADEASEHAEFFAAPWEKV